MKLEFGYGNGIQTVECPDRNIIKILHANKAESTVCGRDEVKRALSDPVGSKRLCKLVKKGQKIAVITSDISRPLPSHEILPPVLDELFAGGIEKKDVKIVFALGSHRRHTEEEKRRLVGGPVFDTVECVDSDPDDVVRLGVTSSGTPVDITRSVAEADFRIALGNIEFHYFAGYSGGSKALMPGVSTPEAIKMNHRMMVLPEARAGRLEGNPVRMDIEEAGTIAGLDFIVNAVLDEHKHIVKVFAGDRIKAHREGCRFLDKLYRVPIPARADIVIVSQGGAPKDANLYQTQKALENAKYAVKDGGSIILIGACKEGMGNKRFEEWLLNSENPSEMVERISKNFELGGHKAAAIGLVMKKAKVYLVSEMDPVLVRRSFFIPAASAQEALDSAFSEYGENAKVIAMPFGGATFPYEAPSDDLTDRKVRE